MIFLEASVCFYPVLLLREVKITLCCIPLLYFNLSFGQSYDGVTGVADSSYTNEIAFEKTRKTHPNIKLVKPFKLANVTEKFNIIYDTIGHRKLKLDVFSPTKLKADNVAIIIFHGGGWRSGNKTQHHPLAQQLANKGYVCFTPEYRLSTEALFPAAVLDAKAALLWVRNNADKYQINPDKIAVLGFSAGGELAAFLGTTQNIPLFERKNTINSSTTVNAVIDIDGTLSFVHKESGEGNDTNGTSAATYWFGYTKAEKPFLWKIASPLQHADKNTPPTLFLNSSVARMHAGRDDYINKLNGFGTYTELYSFNNAPHAFCLFEPWFDQTVQKIDQFLLKVF